MNCGCNPPVENGSIVIKKKKTSSYKDIKLPNSTDRTEELKCEIILDFLDIIDNLECGIQPDLQELLEELSILEIMNTGSFNITKQIYASSKEEEGDDLLRKSKYFTEFDTEEDRRKALLNLGIDAVKHIVLSKEEYENMEYFDKDAIYFITQ